MPVLMQGKEHAIGYHAYLKNQNITTCTLKLIRYLFLSVLIFVSLFGKAQLNIDFFRKKGVDELNSKKFTEAIQTFNILVRGRPDLSEPYLLRGRAKLALGDLKGAEFDFTRAIMNDNYNPEAYYYRGVVSSNLFDYFSALEDFSKSLERRPNNPNVLYSRGITKIRMKNFEGAISDFDTLIIYRPDIEQAYLSRAIAKAENDDLQGAIQDCNKAIRLNIYYVDAFVKRGVFYKMMGEYQEAIRDFDQAIKLEANNTLAYFYRAALHINLQDTMAAILDFDRVLALDPYNDLTYYNRGLIKASRKEFRDALTDMDMVLKINPKNIFTWYNRGIINLNLKEYNASIDDFSEAIKLFPDFAAAYMGRASAKQELKDYQGANEDYEYAIAIINLLNDDDFSLLDQKYSADSDYLKRIIEFEADFNSYNILEGRIQYQHVLIELKPNVMIYYYPSEKVILDEKKRGYVYEPLKEFKYNSDLFSLGINSEKVSLSVAEAKMISDQVDSIMYFNPFDADNYFVKGVLNWMLMNYSEAYTSFSRAIELNPDYFEAYFSRATVLFELIELQYSFDYTEPTIFLSADGSALSQNERENKIPDFASVISDYDKAIKLNPNMYFAYFNRANIKNRMLDFEGAIKDYTIAVALNPEFAEAFYNRALTLIYLNRNAEACFDLSSAGELGIVEAYNVIKRYCGK
ncbi:MAG TPA: tetratricopeptide repeat protein [Bacteroidales bacterium]|nr:tetratricopeptide repeat protein [Bacteroidales bacterium]